MFERIHQKLGTAGFIISIVALVAALGGGAYAATGANGGSGKATASAKQGKQGKPGKTGKTGPTGPAGAPGAKGDPGAPGTNGTNGTPGAAGKSVVVATEAKGANCAEGGASVEAEDSGVKKFVCSGAKGSPGTPGTPGPQGSPWTAGGTLPPGSTETGAWATPYFTEESFVPVTFAIPMAEEISPEHVVRVPGSGASKEAECNDGVAPEPSAAHPEAKPGYLCIFEGSFAAGGEMTSIYKASGTSTSVGASTAGAVLEVFTEAGEDHGNGTWAVTAPLAP
jgi:hypothetical protein